MKIMASDFDGTLFFRFIGDGKGFKDEDLEAIKKFQEAGHRFGVCTGRPLIGIASQCDGKLDLDFYITTSGAAILNAKKEVVYEKCICHETMVKLAKEFEVISDIWIHADHILYVTKLTSNAHFKQHLVNTYEEIPPHHIHGVSFKAKDDATAQDLCLYINEKYKDCNAYRNDSYIDIVANKVSKGNTLHVYAQMIGAEKTYGIGDNFNDITLLEGADVSYTFHNSPKEVKDASDYFVSGVAEAIEDILK